ncbi:S9 family peptidase [Sphingomonas sp. HITSZ_GF]|uniref:alpha/beta hydrolase family protein n=1 Tax=Sphingomonas sp. HITSZ_GF TaxID=3037247 RepID=UPI00240D35B4|nr:S9 family peptidase [Sphingomonas sp. HITSZ_GF]MDG2535557.1 S9 family peptidase [Sphingomonas sp. HITSZ_GF]
MVSRRVYAALLASVWLALPTGAFAQQAGEAAKPADTPQPGPAKLRAPRATEDFAQLPLMDRPKISPDGTLLAAKIASEGKQYFAIVPLNGDKPRYVGMGKYDLNWWRWTNSDWLIVGFGTTMPVDEGEEWYIQRAAGVKADGSKLNMLARDAAQDGDDVIWVAHDGTPRILLAAQHSIYSDDAQFYPSVAEIDVSTGKAKTVVPPRDGVMSWVADGRGMVRMGFASSLDGRESRVYYRGPTGGSFREIVRQKRGDSSDRVLPALFLADPAKAIAYADDDKGYGGIYEYDLATLSKGKLLYASKGFDIGAITTTHDGDGIAGIDYNEASSRTEWIDPDLAKLQAEVSAQIKGGHAAITSYSDDHRRATVYVGGADSPGAYFLYDRADSSMTMLSYANPTLKMARLHPVKTITYKARDGLEIAAVLTLPRGRPAKNLPLIVYPHGGPGARDDESWDWWAQFLADRGYAVIQPNYRGSTGYGTEFNNKGYGEWGLKMQDDLNDAITALASQGIADPKRVCITGGSYGGYAALRAAQRDGKLYRCAVAFAGVSDLGAMKHYNAGFLGGAATGDWLKKQAPDFKAVSPISSPDQFSIPVLLIHGKEDVVVPYSQSREMAEKLRQAGKPVIFISQPQGDHHFTRGEDRLQFLKAMEDFLKQHNPADPAPTQ